MATPSPFPLPEPMLFQRAPSAHAVVYLCTTVFVVEVSREVQMSGTAGSVCWGSCIHEVQGPTVLFLTTQQPTYPAMPQPWHSLMTLSRDGNLVSAPFVDKHLATLWARGWGLSCSVDRWDDRVTGCINQWPHGIEMHIFHLLMMFFPCPLHCCRGLPALCLPRGTRSSSIHVSRFVVCAL